jgi:predicted Fe-Mo cluster-binding NifX family protein
MTRVAVPAGENSGLDSKVSTHLERCPYFVLVDFREGEVKTAYTVPNPYCSQPGQVPDFMLSQQVDVMLSDEMGGREIAFLEQYGIQTMTGIVGTVRHTLEQYIGYRLQEAELCRERGEHD